MFVPERRLEIGEKKRPRHFLLDYLYEQFKNKIVCTRASCMGPNYFKVKLYSRRMSNISNNGEKVNLWVRKEESKKRHVQVKKKKNRKIEVTKQM